jgi:hypothetical protein
MHTYTHALTHTHIHTHKCTHTHTYTCIRTYAYTNTHIHTIIIIIHTESRITLDSLKNKKNLNHLIEEIRKKTTTLEKENWIIEYTWIKAHAGHYGNELADKLTKDATRNSDICYNKIPKSEIDHQEREKSIQK